MKNYGVRYFAKEKAKGGECGSEESLWMTVVFVILGIDFCLLVSLFKPFSVPYKSIKRNEDWCSRE